MILRRFALFAMVAALAVPTSALAQDDDLLTPLTPQPTKPSKSKKTKSTKATPKKPRVSKSTKTKASKSKADKTKTAKSSKTKPPDDDLLVPLTATTVELAVRGGAGAYGATLTVDGKAVGTLSTSASTVSVTPGDHKVELTKEGYATASRVVTVREGKKEEVVMSLDPLVGFGTATADVSGARVYVDGQLKGTVPTNGTGLPLQLKPGQRAIEFRAPGYKPFVLNISVVQGRSYELAGQLRPESASDTPAAVASLEPRQDAPVSPVLTPESTASGSQPSMDFDSNPDAEVKQGKPWYGRWYVWAGVGAVVAAGTVGAVMATQKDANPSLKPGDVCGGPCDAEISGGAGRAPRQRFNWTPAPLRF